MEKHPGTPAVSALAALAAFFFCNAVAAADGELDPAFGPGGFRVSGLSTAAFQLPPKPVVQPDGKIVTCSQLGSAGPSQADFFVARFNADGTPDASFNFGGSVTIDFGSGIDACNAIAVQSDGKIVAAGSSGPDVVTSDFAVARLNADGTLDPTFGAGTGKTLVPFDLGGTNQDVADAIVLQPDNKIVIAGIVDTASNGNDFGVVRLLPDGTRDTTFNSTGRVNVGFDFAASQSFTDQADAVALDDAGRILVSGIAQTSLQAFDMAIARLLPNGQLDANFDADGRATIAFDLGNTNSDISYSMIRDRSGRIVMVGAADTGTSEQNNDVAIARLLQNGTLDSNFGVGGKVVVPFDIIATGNDVATGVVEDSAGRLVVVGAATSDANFNFRSFALRLRDDGTLDPSFGAFGKKVYTLGVTADLFFGVALQGTQLITAGQITSGTDVDNFVARLQVDLIFADGFD
jgi:uncharacterized delta-60 repeat protein